VHQLVRETRRGVELAELAPRRGTHPGLLLELARRGEVGILLATVGIDIEAAGRDLEQRRIGR
jgi:hypothetical protein